MSTVFCKEYDAPALDIREVLRYAKCSAENEECVQRVKDLYKETEKLLTYRVCYAEFDVNITNSVLDLSFCKTSSKDLLINLKDCKNIIVFAATCGSAFDMQIRKASVVSPAKALFLQALGSERVEALCDTFNNEINACAGDKGIHVRPRYSPGYGDLPLSLQQDIFRALNPQKHLGISLSDSFIMSPSKSVTAIIGLEKPIIGANNENQ